MGYFEAPLIGTYAPAKINFIKGSGCQLIDDEGREYLDCLAGIAVVSAGHCNPAIDDRVIDQIKSLSHLSNLFWTEPMALLAKKLHEITGFGKVFFANSGAEANECAVKLVRKWAFKEFGAEANKYRMLCAQESFHGRTLGTLQATGQPGKWEGFSPLGDANIHLPFNDLAAFEAAIDDSVAAVWVEPIQGEGGIVPAELEFLAGLRALCDKHNILLVFDEVQSGIARTGSWWAFQGYGVEPDIFTSAKALGNGLPIGACIAKDEIASCFAPGDHATTFGGGPVPSTAALATIEYFQEVGILDQVHARGALFREELLKIQGVSSVRGKGLMLGAILEQENAKDVASTALAKGLIVNAVRPGVIRLTPPLVITESEIRQACSILSESIMEKRSRG